MFQKLIVVGNLGGDPEMRYTPQGRTVTTFNVATNRRWTGQDGQSNEETTWFRVSVWGRQGEVCNQYLAKGRQVMIEGRLKPDQETGGPRVWMDNEGRSRASFEITASTVRFLGNGSNGAGQNGHIEAEPAEAITEEEIPF